MDRALHKLVLLVLAVAALAFQSAAAEISPNKIGIVVMHGKGGSPTKFVSDLASTLESKGYLVANLEMPWSGRRDYDVDVAIAVKEVASALDGLRAKGATKVFVVGHSQGGLFALYFGGKYPVDGIVAIAPGGSAASPVFREKLGDSVERARRLVAEGKGNEKTQFSDYENSRGLSPVISTPAVYLSWFDPDGAMNQMRAEKNLNPKTPVLFVAPQRDYPGLHKIKQQMYDALPQNPLTKLYEPNASHLDAPSASRDEVVRWLAEVVEKAAGES